MSGFEENGDSEMVVGALALASRGLSVIRVYGVNADGCECRKKRDCKAAGKHPMGADWPRLGTTDEDTIRTWFNHDSHNVGVLTGGELRLVVIDIDGHAGASSIAELEARLGALPETLTTQTGNGTHRFFRFPEGMKMPKTASQVRIGGAKAAGVDVRSNGGMVVAPPSKHRDGETYRFLVDAPIAELPRRWAEAMVDDTPIDRAAERALSSAVRAVQSAAKGARNDVLNRRSYYVGGLVGAGRLDYERSVLALLEAIMSNGGDDRSREQQKIRKAIDQGRKKPVPGENAATDEAGEGAEAGTTSDGDEGDGTTDGVLDRGDHVEMAQRFVTEQASDREPLICSGGSFFRYDAEHGFWRRLAGSEVSRIIQAFAGLRCRGPRRTVLRLKYVDVVGISKLAQDLGDRGNFFAEATPGIAVRNGFLTASGASVSLVPHNSVHRADFCLPLHYEPGRSAPMWVNFLDDVFRDDPDRSDKIRMLAQFIGACLLGIPVRYQRALILEGEGSNGKSVFLHVVAALFPDSKRRSIPPQLWGEGVYRAELEGVRLNTCSELPEADILVSEPFKAIVAGDPICVKRLFHQPHDLHPRAGHIFAANRLPATTDISDGFWRRLIVVRFGRKFSPAEADSTLKERIVDEELAGVLSWGLEGARDLLATGDYAVPASSKEALAEWKLSSDSVGTFVKECCAPSTDAREHPLARVLYAAYRSWALSSGYRPVSTRTLAGRLKALSYPAKHTREGQRYPLKLLIVPPIDEGATSIPPVDPTRDPFDID